MASPEPRDDFHRPASALEVDADLVDDGDSAYGDELTTYTASLTSSVLKYRQENGRSYHAYRDGNYLMPNDEEESDRLDMFHEMLQCVLHRKLFLAPIGDSPGRVLDLGAGTGIWCIQFADENPSAEVTGVDLSPHQPKFVPPNVKFIVDDIEDTWAYGFKFDFIRAHYLAGSIKDWPKLLSQAYESTKPGGWVEFLDYRAMPYSHDGTFKGTALEQYFNIIIDSYSRAGFIISPGPKLEGWIRDAGFTNVHVETFIVPYGIWPKDKHYKKLGTWNLMQLESGLEAAALAVLTRFENWSPDEVKILSAKALSDMKNPRIHSMLDLFAVYAQKPKE